MAPKVEISKRLVALNAASSFGFRILALTVLVWLHRFLLARISPEEYALLPVVWGVMVFAPVFTEFLTGGTARYVVDAYARGDARRVTEIVSSMAPVAALGALIFLLSGLPFAWWVDRLLEVEPGRVADARLMMSLLVAVAAVQVLVVPWSVGLHVRQRFVWINLVHLGEELVRFALLFTLLFGVSVRVLWVVVAQVVSSLLGLAVRTVLSRRQVPELRFDRSLVRASTARVLIGFGGWTSLGNLAGMIQEGAPAIILNKLGTPIDVACFHLGSLASRQMRQMVSLVTAPLQPVLTALHATGRSGDLRRAYLRGGRVFLWLALACAPPLAVFSREIVTLYVGTRYLDAALVMVLLLATFPFIYAATMLYRIVIARAEVRGFFLGAIGVQLLSLAGMLAAAGRFDAGARGVALAIFLACLVGHFAVFWPMGLAISGVRLGAFLTQTLVPGLTPALVSAALCLALRALHPLDGWLAVGLASAAAMSVYAATLLVGCLGAEDRSDLLRLARRAGLRQWGSP